MSDSDSTLTTLDCPHCGKSISVSLGEGASAFECPLCGQGFEVDQGAQTVALPAPTPPSESTPSEAMPQHRPSKKWSGGAIALVTLLICGSAVGIGAFLASQMTDGESAAKDEQNEWTNAQKSGQTIDGVTVRVQSVEVGPVRAKNENGTAFASDRQDYWTVRLRIRNGSDKPIEYKTWHAAEFSGAKPSSAIMKDGTGKRIVMQQFEDVSEIQGQTVKNTLAPRESILDCIVFEAPEEFDKDKLTELRLELPGAACQVNGVFRQVIPKALVE